jgi:hypothetical protein
MFLHQLNLKKLGLIITTALSFSLVSSNFPAQTQPKAEEPKCELFKEVTTDQTEVKKTIQNVLLVKNFNTDFAVPTATKYAFYVGQMTPENTAEYDITINMKYADGSNSTVVSGDKTMERGKTYSLTFNSPTGEQPYQINFRIGGPNNNVYTISVAGCP